MTSREKKECKAYMESLMVNKEAKYSKYKLWDDGILNWLVFRQLMFSYFGIRNNEKLPKDKMKFVQKWAEDYRNKREKELRKA